MSYPQTTAGRLIGTVIFAAGAAGFGYCIWATAQHGEWSYLLGAALFLYAATGVIVNRLRVKKT